MTLIKSISGIRGTIGGKQAENLTPSDAVKYAAAYGCWLKQQATTEQDRRDICPATPPQSIQSTSFNNEETPAPPTLVNFVFI